MNDALKECPFCGAEAIHVAAGHPSLAHYVMCFCCNNATAMTDTREQAAELWNRRVAAPAERPPTEAPTARAPDNGWLCPACGHSNAPNVRECACRGNKTLRDRIHTP